MARVFSAVIYRGEVHPVVLEVRKTRGSLPGWRFVGSVQESVREGKERVWSALKTLGVEFPRGRYTVNIQPAQISKTGSSLDLALAIALLQIHHAIPNGTYTAVGELGLNGEVFPPEGNFALLDFLLDAPVLGSSQLGDLCFHSKVKNLRPSKTLQECVEQIRGAKRYSLQPKVLPRHIPNKIPLQISRSLVKIMAIALAGGHPTLLFGSPGTGKSYTKNLLEILLPQESLERWIFRRVQKDLAPESHPFRIAAPPHTIPRATLVQLLRRNSEVMFLDELPEFRAECREVFRQWLEITPIVESVALPEVTIATANPCPCGYFGTLQCRCRPDERIRYQKKLSGALLDRFAIQWRVSDKDRVQLSSEEWQTWKQKIKKARETQLARQGMPSRASQYSWVDIQRLQRNALFQDGSEHNFRRGLFVLQVAHTLADLESTQVQSQHVFEARQLVGMNFTDSSLL